MHHDNGIMAVRERSTAEAIDLGLVILRRFAIPLYPILAVPLLCCGLPLILFSPWPWLPALVLWWLKPIWDRLVLVPASHLVFHPKDWGQALFRRWRRVRWQDVLADLSWRRFSPYRSFLLPVRLLEGMVGISRRLRLKNLAAEHGGPAVLLSAVLLGLEIALYFGCFPLLVAIFPDISGQLLFQGPEHGPCLGNVVYLVCLLVLEPFYTLAGFTLYLNRRTLLEGWDLVRIFQDIGRKSRGLLVVLALAGFGLLAPTLLAGQTAAEGAAWQSRAKTILADRDFGVEQEVPTWVEKPGWQAPDWTRARLPDETMGPNQASVALSQGLLWVLVALAATVVLALVLSMVIRRRRTTPRPDKAVVVDVAGWSPELATSAGTEKYPDWWHQSGVLWQAGRAPEALSLLYRTLLEQLKTAEGLLIPDSATEDECVRLVQNQAGLNANLVAQIVAFAHARRFVNYALRPLPEADFRHLRQNLLALGRSGANS